MVKEFKYDDICSPFYRRPWMNQSGAASAGHGEKGFKGIVAGGITGAVEACVSYPTEYVKTQLQLDSKGGEKQYNGVIDVVKKTVKQHGILGLYRGLSVLVYGSIPKVALRFGTFESLKNMTEDETGHVSKGQNLINGLLAGMTEAIFAVTPMETIKVKMINDRRSKEPRYKGTVHGIKTIIKEEGIKGIYKGVVPTTLKQGSSQAIRFFCVESLKDVYRGGDMKKDVPIYMVTVFGVIGGFTSVLANTPIDVVKTKMQGLDSAQYKGTIDCIKKIYIHDGLKGFYSGLVPRTIRVCLDVAITFTVYDVITRIFKIIWP